jgi:hypothetical protein
MRKELPLTIVIDRHGKHQVMVGKHVVKGFRYIGMAEKMEPVWDTLFTMGMFKRCPSTKTVSLETDEFVMDVVEELSDVYKPKWFLWLRGWWRNLKGKSLCQSAER